MRNLRFLSRFALPLVAAVVMVCVTACSPDGSALQSTIPAESSVVASINGEKLFDALDIKVGADGAVTLPPEIGGDLFADGDMCALLKGADYRGIYAAVTADGNAYMTFSLTDADAFTDAMEKMEGTGKEDVSGFDKAYWRKGVTWLVKGSQGWALSFVPAKAGDIVKAELKKAADKSVADLVEVPDLLATGNMVDVVLNGSLISKMADVKYNAATSQWAYVWAEPNGANLVIHGYSVDDEGNRVKTRGLQTLNLDFLRYMPGSFDLVAAVGLTSSFDWAPFYQGIAATGNFQTIGMMETMRPFLESIDGTAAFGMELPKGAGVFALPKMLLMIHMDQTKVNESVAQLNTLMASNGVAPSSCGNRLYTLSMGGERLVYGSLDGNLVVSTVDLNPNAANSLTETFEGQKAAMSLRIPDLGVYVNGAKGGLDVVLKCDADSYSMVLKPVGSDRPALLTVASLFRML